MEYPSRMARPKSVLMDEPTGQTGGELKSTSKSKAFAKIAQVNTRQRKYAELRAEGMPVAAAARAAGFKGTGNMKSILENDNRIQALIAQNKAQTATDLKITRQEVLRGFLEAIDVGRVAADPHAMVKGWSEIGKMCGFYAPETRNVNLSISAKRMIDKFETMTDEELLKLAEKTIDGSFERVDVLGNAIEGQAPLEEGKLQ